ncbi:MAG: hypothetical protein AB7N65_28780 [Vicinamibacterales bacterium]
MRDGTQGDRCGARRTASTARRRASRPIVLWRLRGATDDLRGLAVETSFGYALGLELDAELVLLHLQPSLECLVAYAERIESALVAQGWQVIDAPAPEGSRHASC